MATITRRDDWVQNAMGQAISGASVYYCTQPANTGSVPPSPLAAIFTDSTGSTPLTQPVVTDGFGHAVAYLAEGIYTIVYSAPSFNTPIVLIDQVVVGPFNNVTPAFQIDCSTPGIIPGAGTITGTIDGTNTSFTLTAQPTPTSSLTVSVNGVIQYGWTISGQTITLAVAPHSGNILYAQYTT